VNHRGDISYHGAILTHKHEKVNEFIDELFEALQPAIAEAGGPEYIRGIGIGAPKGNIYN
jgi:glucokinase